MRERMRKRSLNHRISPRAPLRGAPSRQMENDVVVLCYTPRWSRIYTRLVALASVVSLTAGALACERAQPHPPPRTPAEAFYRAAEAAPVSDNNCRSAGGLVVESAAGEGAEPLARAVVRVGLKGYCLLYRVTESQLGPVSTGKLCCYPVLDFSPDPLA